MYALRRLALRVARVEEGGAILRADVGPLAVELRGIVRDGEEHGEQLLVRHLRRIVHDAHGLRVARAARAHLLVVGARHGAARVARRGAHDAVHVLEDRLHSPEASAGEHGGVGGRGGRTWRQDAGGRRGGGERGEGDERERSQHGRDHRDLGWTVAPRTRGITRYTPGDAVRFSRGGAPAAARLPGTQPQHPARCVGSSVYVLRARRRLRHRLAASLPSGQRLCFRFSFGR